MKQNISDKQLQELNEDQREKLIEWYQSVGDYTRTPLLTIGEMIAFIQDKKPLLKGISKNRFNQWFINIDNGMLGYKDELCDALWESVQQILKQP